MAIGDFFSDMGLDLSAFGGLGSAIPTVIGFVIVAVAIGLFTFWIINKRSYNMVIHVFEEISGNTSPIDEDKAKEIVLPFTSVRAIYLKRRKIFLPRPSIQTGRKHYWYFVRKDGEWINVKPVWNPDTNQFDLISDHADMRLANASLKKLVEKSYKKLNWIKEYAPYIAIAILILMLAIAFYMIFSKAGESFSQLSGVAESLKENLEVQKEILQSLENIKASSGVRSG